MGIAPPEESLRGSQTGWPATDMQAQISSHDIDLSMSATTMGLTAGVACTFQARQILRVAATLTLEAICTTHTSTGQQ